MPAGTLRWPCHRAAGSYSTLLPQMAEPPVWLKTGSLHSQGSRWVPSPPGHPAWQGATGDHRGRGSEPCGLCRLALLPGPPPQRAPSLQNGDEKNLDLREFLFLSWVRARTEAQGCLGSLSAQPPLFVFEHSPGRAGTPGACACFLLTPSPCTGARLSSPGRAGGCSSRLPGGPACPGPALALPQPTVPQHPGAEVGRRGLERSRAHQPGVRLTSDCPLLGWSQAFPKSFVKSPQDGVRWFGFCFLK